MFTEILRIKPVLEPATTARMERTLVGRFTKVTKTFGKALKAVVSGTALGIGLNILTKILNPIQDLEEKMDALLGKGKDLSEQADRFGTTGGRLKRLQDVGAKLGISPEDLNKLMEKFAESVETGREEISKPVGDQSAATQILSKDFLENEDLADSFLKFVQSLKYVEPDRREKIEREVLGERLFGSKKQLWQADFAQEFAKSLPLSTIEKAFEKAADTEYAVRQNRVGNEQREFVNQGNTLGPGTVGAIQALEARRAQQDLEKFAKFNETAAAAKGIEEAAALLKKPLDGLVSGIGKLVIFIDKISSSRWFRNIGGGSGGASGGF